MLAFSETRFNTEIRYGTSGGAEFSTDVTIVTSGAEFRNSNWLDSRGNWTVADDVFNKKEIDGLIAFFRDRKGRAGGFRFKDWSDFRAIQQTDYREGTMEAITGSSAMQMVKRYVVGADSTYRIITKPVSGTVVIHNGAGTIVTTGFTIDYAKGQIAGASADWTWTGEFDLPARFDTDKFNSTFEGYRPADGEAMFTVSGLTIVELSPSQFV